jgi:hypothetical protein
MLDEIRRLQERKKGLLDARKITKEKKQEVIDLVQTLIVELNSGRISKQEYAEKLNKLLDKRTSEQWIKYYDDFLDYYNYQIKLCDRLIKEEKLKGLTGKVKEKGVFILKILIGLVFIGLIISLFVIFKPIVKELGEIEDIERVIVSEQVSVLLEEGEVVEESLYQHQAVLGQNVRWKKEFVVEEGIDFKLELPEGSENIKVKQMSEDGEKDITDNMKIDEKGIFRKRVEIKTDKKTITGQAILNGENKIRYEIEFETPMPQIIEEDIEKGKRVIIKGPDDIHYENILSFAKLPRNFEKSEASKIKIYQINLKNGEEIRNKVDFSVYDTNEDGFG